MDVHAQAVERLAPAIDVSKIDDLARIAERQNTMILHVMLNSVDHYLVQGKGVTYRYVISNDKTDLVEAIEAPRKDVRNYISNNHSKRNVDPKPASEVLFMDPAYNESCQTQIAKPAEKIVMRYSMNISKDYIQN